MLEFGCEVALPARTTWPISSMPFSFLQRENLAELVRQLTLASYQPSLTLEGLTTGVDNVRSDVSLSSKFSEAARLHIARLVISYGNVEEVATEDAASLAGRPPAGRANLNFAPKPAEDSAKARSKSGDPAEFKRMLVDVQVAGLNRAKAENNLHVDLMARLAVIKFLRNEMPLQFNQV